ERRYKTFTIESESNFILRYISLWSVEACIVGHQVYSATSTQTGPSPSTGYAYDTHAPLLFIGKGINHGSSVKRTEIPDIANTIAALLGIAFPSGSNGEPISEALQLD